MSAAKRARRKDASGAATEVAPEEAEYMHKYRTSVGAEAADVFGSQLPRKIRSLQTLSTAPEAVDEGVVRRELTEIVVMLKTLRVWLTTELPPAAESGSFATQVHRLLIEDLKAAADACTSIIAQSHADAGAVISVEMTKYPYAKDFDQALGELKEAQRYACRRRVVDVATVLTHIINIVNTNAATIPPLSRLVRTCKAK
eukprot:m51a1_g9697 hypothetical protein (200) ;mRNA; f:1373150-1374243